MSPTPGVPSQPIAVSFGPVPATAALEREWRALEARADGSFFTSWSWIGCWLECLPPRVGPMLLQAKVAAQTVGLAIFVPRAVRRHHLLSSRALYLHATGDPRYDTATIESNGLLVDRAHSDPVALAMIGHLATACPQWEEVFLEATSNRPQAPVPNGGSLRVRQWERPTFYVDLEKIRTNQSDYFGLLRPTVRYQIRRTVKAYSEHGAVRARTAADLPQAIEFFDQMKRLHQTHWLSKGLPGAFGGDFMCRFHEKLISRCFDRGEIQLLRVEAGDRPLGYLYNFVHRGIVSNYQAGIDYTSDSGRGQPGLAAHALCAEFNARAGHRVYDLMMGDQPYKRRICTDQGSLHWTVVQRQRLKFRLEDALRALKARWREPVAQSIPDPTE